MYFDINGFVVFDTLEELIEKANKLTREYYNDKIEIIEKNFVESIKWIDYKQRLIEKIQKTCNV